MVVNRTTPPTVDLGLTLVYNPVIVIFKGLIMSSHFGPYPAPVFATMFPSLAELPAIKAYATLRQAGQDVLAMPFDMARASYVQAVRAGLIERSMLASRDFERTVAAMETITLGPLARKS